jgi:hypothetical protein
LEKGREGGESEKSVCGERRGEGRGRTLNTSGAELVCVLSASDEKARDGH